MNKYVLLMAGIVSTLLLMSAEAQSKTKYNQTTITLSLGIPSLKVGEPFLSARSKILKAGWRPIRMHSNEDYEYSGTERLLAERKFLEVDYCSTDAGSLCVLYYRKGRQCLRLGTVGEQLKCMEVTRWSAECPAEPIK